MTSRERSAAFFVSLGLESAGPRVESLAREFESVSARLERERNDARDTNARLMSEVQPLREANALLEKERKGLRDELDILREEHEEAMARGAALVAENTRHEGGWSALRKLIEQWALVNTKHVKYYDGSFSDGHEQGERGAYAYVVERLRQLLPVDGTTADNATFRQPAATSDGWRVAVCGNCGGDGFIAGVTCNECRGRGRVAERVKP
jgi:chromosome segregation ATPase